jgi:hypothetical protein
MAEGLWDLLARIVEQRSTIHVDEDGEIVRIDELDELLAAKHVKRFINVWGNRRRKSLQPDPDQLRLDGEGEEPGATYPGEMRVSEVPVS